MIRFYLLTFAIIGFTASMPVFSLAQFVVHNNGAQAYVRPGCVVSIRTGDLENASGNFSNSGTVTVEGDVVNGGNLNGGGAAGQFNVRGNWINNANFIADQTTVALNGGNQSVAGTAISSFYNLDLQGTGVKSLGINAGVANELRLNNRELATQGNVMHVTNTATAAISYTTGFVSSTGNGRLRWDMAGTGPYIFQVGSSVGTPRVRPVRLDPAGAAVSYSVRFANTNPTSEGYSISQLATGVCQVNSQFYHLIERTAGTASTGITQYYNLAQDGNWNDGVHWNPSNQWQDQGSTNLGSTGTYNTVNIPVWNNFSIPAFALSRPSPTVNLNGLPASSCQNGSTASLTATPTGGTFSGPGILSPSTVFNPAAAGIGTHLISYTFTDASGCSGSDIDTVQVYAAPLVALNVSGPPSFCAGDSIQIGATPGFTSYVWNNSSTNDTITVSQGGQYSVTATDANGCSATSANANITVYPTPTPVITSSDSLEFCHGESALLTVGNSYSAYEWSNGAITFSTVVTEAGMYACTVTNQYLCTATSDSVEVTILNGLTGTIQADGNSIWVEPAGSDYQWFLNGTPIPGATGQSYQATQSGNYTVQYNSLNGCPSDSYILEFTYIGVGEIGPFTELSLYPNPGNGEVFIEGSLRDAQIVEISVYDIVGRSVLPIKQLANSVQVRTKLDLREFAKGVYMIRVTAGSEEVVFRYVRD